MAIEDASRHGPRIADRLAAVRRGRFVGRMAELDLLRSALLSPSPPFVVLYLYGPGGVGKTALLHEYARVASESGRPCSVLDARNFDASPAGFVLALCQALGLQEAALPGALAHWPAAGVLLIDTYELLAPIDGWLRETFLPQLPTQSLVVLADRNAPAPGWRSDMAWAELTHRLALGNLRPEESETYLAARGIPGTLHPEVLAFTHGHPLALALVADQLARGGKLGPFDPRSEPDIVRMLLERMAQDVPSASHRLALEVCVVTWATTEALLAAVVDGSQAHALFEWLRQCSFIQQGPSGLFPHDLAREALDADLRWRNPERYQRVLLQVADYLHARFQQAGSRERQRIWSDLIYLLRHHPFYQPFFAWTNLDSLYAEPAATQDHPAIIEMVHTHQGAGAARIAEHWLRRQPEAFLVYRSFGGPIFGFMAQLMIHNATAEDCAIDPALPAALAYAQRHGPLRPGEQMLHLRFWMDREAYQEPSAAVNLTAINGSISWMSHPRLAWNFIAIAAPEFFEPHFTSVHMWRAPEADFEVEGRRYGIFAHDWRVEPAAAWFGRKTVLANSLAEAPGQPQPAPASALLLLSEREFADAVRQALRDYTRPDRLAASPLLRSRLLVGAGRQAAAPAELQALLRQAATTLTGSPRDMKLHRAVWHTYIEPAPTQEQAAELLGLPFNTYRYQLANAIDRITSWLWQRELSGPGA